MKKVFKIMVVLVMVFSIVGLTGCNKNDKNDKLTIITTSFPGYDFARAITKDNNNVEVKMLLKPGAEMHDFEPTPQDIKDIKNSDIFIYVGGDSDEWIEDVLDNIDTDKTKIVKLMDLVDTVPEDVIEGMEEHEEGEEEEEVEYDEHVWTSPINAITITNKLKDEVVKIDNDNKELYEKNASNYVNELTDIDNEIKDIVKNGKRKEIVFGDRFPLRYFVDSYGLSYYAAFPGCSEQTEASAKTISFLINKVKEDKIPVVFHIELSKGKIANAIAKETGIKVLEFKTAHNISQKDFDAGVTYVDIMKDNIKVLKEALN
jgi:zinc transport system substrate-binding protein